MEFEKVLHGRNSVLYSFDSESVLYEKLSNTIHIGKREKLGELKKVEDLEPIRKKLFESYFP